MPLKKVLLSRREEERTQAKELLQSCNSYFMSVTTHRLFHVQMAACVLAALQPCQPTEGNRVEST